MGYACTECQAHARQAMGIQRYVFFSIHNADRHPDVPLMQIKARTEEFLADSGLNFTILRLCGFMQAIIGNYAVPILEEKQVWGTSDATRTAYLDSQVRRHGCPMCRACILHPPLAVHGCIMPGVPQTKLAAVNDAKHPLGTQLLVLILQAVLISNKQLCPLTSGPGSSWTRESVIVVSARGRTWPR